MQWVSTFASGASSLGRARRLEVHPEGSGPPSSRGKIRRELPSLYTEALGEKKGKKNLQRLGAAPKVPTVGESEAQLRALGASASGTCGTYTTLERHWDAPGFLLAFEARFAYLKKTPASEVSDGSTCT